MISRRSFIKGLGAAGVLSGTSFASRTSPLMQGLWSDWSLAERALAVATGSPFVGNIDPWEQLPAILARIREPQFAARDFDVTHYGARGDNKTDCTMAFEKVIAACHAAGGGRVVVPEGEFLSGAVQLRSNVNLHVSEHAVLRFTRDTKKYPLVFTRWEGMELMNFSPFIYAFEQENIAITGKGVIDGNADCEHWWPWKGRTHCGWVAGQPKQEDDRNLLLAMAEKDVPVKERIFGEGHYLRRISLSPIAARMC